MSRLNTRGRVSYRIDPVCEFERHPPQFSMWYRVEIFVDKVRVKHWLSPNHTHARRTMSAEVRAQQSRLAVQHG